MPETNLSVDHVSVSFGPPTARLRAVDDVSLEFTAGTLSLVMGPSGSGKTTLLSLLGCLLRPDEGRVFVNHEDTGKWSEEQRTELRSRHIGFIFQAFRLLHSLTALENVMIAAEIAGVAGREQRSRALGLLQELKLENKAHLKPDALSGGEKQRVAVARALLSQPGILLADEPTASLDSASGRQICEILQGLAEERGHIVVVVAHDTRWTEFAHRVVVLEDGRISEIRSRA